MIVAVLGLFLPLLALVGAGVAMSRGTATKATGLLVVGVISAVAWLGYVGLYEHETSCGGHRCDTVYGYRAPLTEDSGTGALLILVGFAGPAAIAGRRRWGSPMAIGAAIAAAPTVLAFWTAPRGDNDGLWVLVLWMLPIAGFGAAAVAAVAGAVGRTPKVDGSAVDAPTVPRVAAVLIDVLVVGTFLTLAVDALQDHLDDSVLVVAGLLAATLYLAVPVARTGRTLGAVAAGVAVVGPSGTPPTLSRAFVRGFVVAVEVGAASTVVLGLPAAVELIAVAASGRSITDRVLGTRVVATMAP